MRNQGRLDDALAYFRNAAQAGGARAAVYLANLRKDQEQSGQTRDRNRVTEVLATIQDMGER
jgi:hypothetical protein